MIAAPLSTGLEARFGFRGAFVGVAARAGAYRTLLTHFSTRYPRIPVLLTGGGDVQPSIYGAAAHPTFDARRLDAAVIKAAKTNILDTLSSPLATL